MTTPTLDDTFAMFFGPISEDDAAADQEYIRAILAKVDTARAANDWRTLEALGYAQRVDGPYEGQYRWEFDQYRYDNDRETLSLTPAQVVKRRQDYADR